MNKKTALNVLEEEIFQLSVACEKAMVIAGSLQQEYFGPQKPNPLMLEYQYGRYSQYCYIVGDYLFEMSERLKRLLGENKDDEETGKEQ